MQNKIVPLLPVSKIYVEVFGGGASILFAKQPSGFEIYNDIDSGLYNFFSVISDEEKFKLFYNAVSKLPYSRELYDCSLRKLKQDKEQNEITKAVAWFICIRQGFAGTIHGGWNASLMKNEASVWVNTIKRLPEIHKRLHPVTIEKMDWDRLIDYYDSIDTLFYFDPPYVLSTRVGGKLYGNEMTDSDHVKLVERIQNVKGQFVLSGYDNEIYKILNKYEMHKFDVPCHVERIRKGESRSRRTEVLWIKRYLENTLF